MQTKMDPIDGIPQCVCSKSRKASHTDCLFGKIYLHASVSAATEWHGGDLGEITADAMLRDGGKLAGQTLLPPEHPLPHQPQVASKKKYIIIMEWQPDFRTR